MALMNRPKTPENAEILALEGLGWLAAAWMVGVVVVPIVLGGLGGLDLVKALGNAVSQRYTAIRTVGQEVTESVCGSSKATRHTNIHVRELTNHLAQ